jgi:hypothetical protein
VAPGIAPMSTEDVFVWAVAELAKSASATVTTVLAYMLPRIEGGDSWSARN